MKPPVFDYYRVSSVEEAVARLSQHGPDAKILAGGQSLIPMMKLRLALPSVLVDINHVDALDYLRVETEHVAIGATRRQYMLDAHEPTSALIGDALPYIGHEATRHRGTLCGSLAHADPAAELPVIASCLDAEIVAMGPAGARTIAANDFFSSFFATSLEPDEMVTEVRLPLLPAGTGWSFHELSKRHAKFALVAVTLGRDRDASVTRARIAMGAVGERPIRAAAAEAELEGATGDLETFRAAAAAAVAEIDPPSDVHGGGAFRKKVAQVLVERALAQAWRRAQTTGETAAP
jgi:carbon-monoxide dehydrogenase medium subunit